jgi:pimeloyl-ACP methyl ester carboxylesterase
VLLVLLTALPIAEGTAFSVVPPTRLGEATPSSFGLSFRDVTFRTIDGAVLSAWYVPTRNGAAVVVRHGAGSTRTAALAQAAVVAGAGYGVALVDARGHGRSGGIGNDRGWFGERDISAAVTFLVHQPRVDPARIGVLGLSMGGEEAIGAAGADMRVRAVVAEGVTSRTAQDKARWLPGGLPGLLQRGMDRLTDQVVLTLSPAPKPQPLWSAIRDARASVLLVTAGKEPDEVRAAVSLRAPAPQRVSTWNVVAAAHTHGLATDPIGWCTRVLAFLDTHLAPVGSDR